MSYTNHLDTIIRKSTFTIPSSRLAEHMGKDGFIDPMGNFIRCGSHHHVEKALSILKTLDDDIKWTAKEVKKHSKELDDLNTCLNYLKNGGGIKDKRINKKLRNVFGFRYEYDVKDKETETVIRKLENRVTETCGFLDYVKNRHEEAVKNSKIQAFKRANKNKGYDAAEYLIVSLGYIAVEGGYLLYRNARSTQVYDYNLYIEKDENGKCVICPLTTEEAKERLEKERNKVKKQASYYSDSRNRFHCPSGFTRGDYNRWRNQCYKVGLNPNDLIHQRF